MSREGVRRSRATWGMLGLAAALTALPVADATRSVLRMTGVLGVDREAALRDGLASAGIFNDERSLRVAEGYAALVTVPVAITCLIVVVGLLTWREWAREAALGVFGLIGMLLLVLSVNGLSGEQVGRNADWGLAVSLLVLAVAALAVSPPVRADWERKAVQRAVRERAAATAARQARAAAAQAAARPPGPQAPAPQPRTPQRVPRAGSS